MSIAELSQGIRNLNRFNTEHDDEASDNNLTRLFDSCLQLNNLIEESSLSTGDKEFQEAVNVCIKTLEKCTLMVNELDLFSSNETFDELLTSSIRYLMIPAMLGSLTIGIQSKDLSERMKFIEMAEVYFRDFILRCKNYEAPCESMKDFDDIIASESNDTGTVPGSITVREKKIKHFKRKKDLSDRLKRLKPALQGRPEAEEYIREYYLLLLEKWILIALEELGNIKNEKEILKSIPGKEDSSKNNVSKKQSEIKPLKPIIITKNEIQKRVFGVGYPSIPVLTIDDFYRQRFEKAIEQQKSARGGKSLQDAAFSGGTIDKEIEETEKEKLIESDDPIALMKARQWDDWKDDNPRGSGNRYNKG